MIFKVCSSCGKSRPESVFPDSGKTCRGCVDRESSRAEVPKPARKRRGHWKKKAKAVPDRWHLDREAYRGVCGCEPPERYR